MIISKNKIYNQQNLQPETLNQGTITGKDKSSDIYFNNSPTYFVDKISKQPEFILNDYFKEHYWKLKDNYKKI